MSRSNPYKKKRRVAGKTLLLYGEGLREEQFLKCLKGIYSFNHNIAVTIRKGSGGSPADIVIQASRVLGDYDKRVILVDNDKGLHEMEQAKTKASQRGIEIIFATPCIEALFLAVIDGNNYSSKSSAWCKGKFESKLNKKRNRIEVEDFIAIFKKPLLEKRRNSTIALNRIIKLLQGN